MQNPESNPQYLLTVPEVAKILRTGPARIRKYIREGQLKCVYHGRRILIPQSEPERFVQDRAQ